VTAERLANAMKY